MRRGWIGILGAAALVTWGAASLRAAAAQSGGMGGGTAATPAKAATITTDAPLDLRAIAEKHVDDAQAKFLALAEAIPADKYSWRPGAGVRSVGEVFMHVAAANYLYPTRWGAKPARPMSDLRDLEKQGGDKAKTVATLKDSFNYLHNTIDALSEADFAHTVSVSGHNTSVLDLALGAGFHAHEHLGQEIAYARSNGVVPPWSAGSKD